MVPGDRLRGARAHRRAPLVARSSTRPLATYAAFRPPRPVAVPAVGLVLIVVFVAVGIVMGLCTFIVPKFVELFRDLDQQFVPDAVPIGVVHVLEVVDVDDAQRERQPVPLADAPAEAAVPPTPAPEDKPALIKH